MFRLRLCAALGTIALLLTSAGSAAAARVQIHYTPADCNGNMNAGVPTTTTNRIAFFGPPETAPEVPIRPNQVVAFRHPATGRIVKVPLALYQGTPKMRYRTNLVMYDYGSDAIEVRFLADGSVDVIYNSGFLRRW